MKLTTIVWREIFERRTQLATSFLAILLGIAVIVATRNITYYSEKAVAKQLDALGANVLILPKSATLQDYFTADMQSGEIPEEYVAELTMSNLQGLDNLSPKLAVQVQVNATSCVLTGILPKQEFMAKAAWQGAGIFTRPEAGCGSAVALPGEQSARETLVRNRVIETLGPDEMLAGADIAARLGLRDGSALSVLGRDFTVSAILPQTGTVDDSRLFAHLHTVQELAGRGPVVSAIEVVGCCREISAGLVDKINQLLPDAKVVTITQVVDTQIRTNRMMSQLSLVFLTVIVLVGGASIANYMYANVHERRREVGTLLAMGASPSLVRRMFLLKALLLGLAGGLGGYAAGIIMAATIGPHVAGVPIPPLPSLILTAVPLSVVISVAASYLPARRAANLDPCATLQEV